VFADVTNDMTMARQEIFGPVLVAIPKVGIGYETTAQLLITAGDNPDRIGSEAASSAKSRRHRLSRGGNRHADRALHLIACTWLVTCARTRAYRDRRA
jgi:transposase